MVFYLFPHFYVLFDCEAALLLIVQCRQRRYKIQDTIATRV